MCSATREEAWHRRVDRSTVGVFAYRSLDGRPIACAVTPYLHDGDAVITCTLSFPLKAIAAAREGAAALFAGGVSIRGPVEVTVDRSGRTFDAWVREQELRKYPPARSLLSIPGHRRLFPWYVSRVFVRFVDPHVEAQSGSDRTTATTLDSTGVPLIVGAPEPPPDPLRTAFSLAGSGPACVLVHDESDDMAQLRQQRIDGQITDAMFHATHVVGSLDPQPTGTRAEIAKLRELKHRAKRNEDAIARLTASTTSRSAR